MTVAQSPISLDDALGIAAQMMLSEQLDSDDRVNRCAKDIREFAKHVWLNDPIEGPIPFAMWDWQQGLLELWSEERLVCVLKARQLGVSWLVAVYVLWKAMFNASQRILLVSIGQLEADQLLAKVSFILEHLPSWLKPTMVTDNVRKITFEAIDSEIESLPSTGRVGRSRSASLVVLDEHAHQANDSAIWTAIKPTVERGQLISISTANGLGALHTRIYKSAKEGRGGFVPVFIPWTAHPDRTAEWYEQERESFRMSAQPQLFEQEYPATDEEAFVVSGNPVWTAAEIAKQPIKDGVPPIEPGLWMYEAPKANAFYAIGVDTAEGTVGGDWCSAAVIRIWKDESSEGVPRYLGKQVAHLRGLWPTEQYAERIDALARRYAIGFRPRYARTVLVGVERNNHGHAVLLRLRQLNTKDEPYSITSWGGKLGWLTDKQTRPIMYDEFAGAIRTGAVQVSDPVTVSQMSTFSQTRFGGEAQSGYHDDDLTALAIAWQHHRRVYGVTIEPPRGNK